jgi:hypothetical protein
MMMARVAVAPANQIGIDKIIVIPALKFGPVTCLSHLCLVAGCLDCSGSS